MATHSTSEIREEVQGRVLGRGSQKGSENRGVPSDGLRRYGSSIFKT